MTILRVVDFETTGLPPDAKLCEIGWVDVWRQDGAVQIGPVQSLFVNPGCPIPPEAMAVHHIRDADVTGAVDAETALRQILDGCRVFVAHSAQFERQFFDGGGLPWICTYRVALRLWPDAPSHKNQVLRYFLGIDCDPALAMPPHRAGPDAYVTAHLLKAAIEAGATVNEMIDWTEEPALLPKCQFGKHRGSAWPDVPTDYLQWITGAKDMDPDVVFTARHHLALRQRVRANA